ncbi:MAG: glycosyltransferase family 4 protein [Schleiferiaceae bacterium]|nr:glycosyltransferase family 4 protein [Schleiferiaceae bacterium]
MEILLLCNKFPYPPDDGSSLAIFNLISELAVTTDVQLTIFSLNTKKHFKDTRAFPKELLEKCTLHTHFIDTDITFSRTLANLFTTKAFHASRFITRESIDALVAILKHKTFDVIHLESVFMGVYLPLLRQHSTAKLTIRMHNIESLLWERQTEKEKGWIKKWYLRLQTKRLKRFEKDCLQSADALVPITQVDATFLKEKQLSCKPVHVLPFGVTPTAYQPNPLNNTHRINFLGSMDWLPNQMGLQWFLDNVWSIVQQELPHLALHIAGKNTHLFTPTQHYPNVVFEGTVPDAKQFLRTGNIFIVPILTGSGVRIKMLEAMATGCCVVSTSIGAEGIIGENGKHYEIADTPEAFAATLIDLVTHPEKQQLLSKNARTLVDEQYNNNALTNKLIAFYNQL